MRYVKGGKRVYYRRERGLCECHYLPVMRHIPDLNETGEV